MERPEVNPVVTNMPTEGNHLNSGGSARIRKIDLTTRMINDTTCEFDVTGVPGHTHNASSVISVVADYSKTRARAIVTAANTWGPGTFNFAVNYPTDSVLPDNFEERANRAIERGIGSIAMTPENCNSFISEPTRSISEIRTLTCPSDQLQTQTYVEETSGWQVVGDNGTTTPLVSSFPDVVVDILPLTQFLDDAKFISVTANTANGGVPPFTTYIMYEEGTTFADPGGAIVPSDPHTGKIAENWDGCLVFSWDTDAHQYVSAEVTFTPYIVVRPLTSGLPLASYVKNADNDNATHATAANRQERLTITIPPIRTTVAKDGYCLLAKNLSNIFSFATNDNVSLLNLAIPFEVEGASDDRDFLYTSSSAYRIPVGSSVAIPTDLANRVPARAANANGNGEPDLVIHDLWDYTADRTPAKIIKDMDAWAIQQELNIANNAHNITMADVNAMNFRTRSITRHARLVPDRKRGFTRECRTHAYGEEFDFAEVPFSPLLNTTDFAALPQQEITTYIPVLNHPKREYTGLANPGANNMAIQWTNIADTPDSGMSVVYSLVAGSTNVNLPDVRMLPKNMFIANKITLDLAPYRRLPDGSMDTPFTNAPAVNNVINNLVVPVPIIVFSKVDTLQKTPTTLGVTASTRLKSFLDFLAPSFPGPVPTGVALGDIHGALGPAVQGFTVGGLCTKINYQYEDGVDAAALARINNFHKEAPNNNITTFRNAIGTGFEMAISDDLADEDPICITKGGAGSFTITFANILFAVPEGSYMVLQLNTPLPNAAGAAKQGQRITIYAPVPTTINNFRYVYDEAADGSHDNTAWIMYCHIPHTDCKWYNPADGIAEANRFQSMAGLSAVIPDAILDNSATMYLLSSEVLASWTASELIRAAGEDAGGAIFNSKKRISQHICAPVLNPNARMGAIAPLNFDTRHLPPELRDFSLRLGDVDWSRLKANKVDISDITLYQFNGGIQQQAVVPSVLHLPHFVEYKQRVSDLDFSIECQSSMGSPAYYVIFCRDDARRDRLQTPKITQVTIRCLTTKKKSNSVSSTKITELYHMTQRNCHSRATYTRAAFNKRQTILLSAEDVGMMGIKKYQHQKRAVYEVSGKVDMPGTVYVVLVYSNRALIVQGRNLDVRNI